MKNSMHIGQVIQMLRHDHQLKQGELAQLIKMSTSMISVIERTGKVKDSVLMAIAKALNTTPENILNYNKKNEHDMLKEFYALKENYNMALLEIKSLKKQLEDKEKIIALLEKLNSDRN